MSVSTGVSKNFSFSAFLTMAGVWAVAGSVICIYFAQNDFSSAVKWFLGIGLLCLIDLAAMARLLDVAIQMMDTTSEKRVGRAVQAFYWGAIKLACLGLLGWVMLMRSNDFTQSSKVGLLAGLGTLVAVPLLGGFLWSHKELSHA